MKEKEEIETSGDWVKALALVVEQCHNYTFRVLLSYIFINMHYKSCTLRRLICVMFAGKQTLDLRICESNLVSPYYEDTKRKIMRLLLSIIKRIKILRILLSTIKRKRKKNRLKLVTWFVKIDPFRYLYHELNPHQFMQTRSATKYWLLFFKHQILAIRLAWLQII